MPTDPWDLWAGFRLGDQCTVAPRPGRDRRVPACGSEHRHLAWDLGRHPQQAPAEPQSRGYGAEDDTAVLGLHPEARLSAAARDVDLRLLQVWPTPDSLGMGVGHQFKWIGAMDVGRLQTL